MAGNCAGYQSVTGAEPRHGGILHLQPRRCARTDVAVVGPLCDDRGDPVAVREEHLADQVLSDLVDQVPPSA
jgi:hypothetical protein